MFESLRSSIKAVTANEALGFFRDNWNWIKDRVQDRIDDDQFIDDEVAI
jgi:hypothetical protein